jgi:multiple sugar transport system permease protein
MIVHLAALQGVPTALYEAATIDGANGWQKFRNVTLPMISPVILFTFVTGVIASFQIFAPAYIITGRTGKPANAGLFYVLYLFLNAFSRFRFGYAAAQAWILLIIILVLTYFMLRASRSMVHYESNDDKNL